MKGELDPVLIKGSDSVAIGVQDRRQESLETAPPSLYLLQDPLGKYPVLIKDPLSEVTRKERKTFLGVSVLAIALVQANLIPKEITALGVKIEDVDEHALLVTRWADSESGTH
jgi:hypothetical protein